MRKNYRPYRNRAIVYALIETDMRRAAVRNLNLEDVDFKKRSVSGLAAIKDCVDKERAGDNEKWQSPALFLSAESIVHGDGWLNLEVINTGWNEACELAGVGGHTPMTPGMPWAGT